MNHKYKKLKYDTEYFNQKEIKEYINSMSEEEKEMFKNKSRNTIEYACFNLNRLFKFKNIKNIFTR